MEEKKMNKVIIIGNLTKDPEHQTTTSGVSVCRFTVAVQRKFENAEGEREADFLNVVAWKGTADSCHKFLSKGKKCCVVGSLQTRSYDATDGTKRYVTEIIANEVEFLTPKQQSEGSAEPADLTPVDDDSLPF